MGEWCIAPGCEQRQTGAFRREPTTVEDYWRVESYNFGENPSLRKPYHDHRDMAEVKKDDEDIGVDEVSSVIDGVFDIGESNVESMESDTLSLKDGGGEVDDGLDGINLDLSQDFVIRILESRDVSGRSLVIFLKWVYRVKSRGAAKGGKRVLCYVQGSGRGREEEQQIEAKACTIKEDYGISGSIRNY
ncbi:hypothetical protein Tco_1286019 [Tanacetum coccineum]